jgi:hypothetical protein
MLMPSVNTPSGALHRCAPDGPSATRVDGGNNPTSDSRTAHAAPFGSVLELPPRA